MALKTEQLAKIYLKIYLEETPAEISKETSTEFGEFIMSQNRGIWAVGDIRSTPFKQAVVAAGDGCMA